MLLSHADYGGGRPPLDPVLRARDERLETAKAVIGKLAHDFNNFLAPQLGYVTLLKEDLPVASSNLQYVQMIELAARKAEASVQAILLAVRPQRKFSPEEMDLSVLLREVVEGWIEKLEPGHGIEVSTSIDDCRIVGDSRQWENVFQQLLRNARYALATGGKLEISLNGVTLEGEEMQRLGISEQQVHRLVFRDSGFGMDPEVARRAFEPFFTTRTHSKAAGLGLTTVHSVARLHGGQVELTSSPDRGTEVTVWVSGAATRRLERAGLSAQRSDRLKVLFLSANPLIIEVLRTCLIEMGAEPHLISRAEELPAALERHGDSLRLIICDFPIDPGGAEDLLTQIGRAGATPVIALRNSGAEGDLGSECVDELIKPFTLRTFQEIVRRYIV